MTGQTVNTVKKRNSLVPSFLSGGQNRNDDRRKEYNLTLSEESGIGYRKTHLISPTFAWILHSTPYFFILVFLTAFYDRSRMTDRYLVPLKNRTHLYQILTTPVGRVWHLTRFYSVALLLENRFACHHFVQE